VIWINQFRRASRRRVARPNRQGSRMRRSLFSISLALLSALLTACVATAPAKPEAGYPSRLEDFGQYERFPATVAV
jgi:hypothetical protein